MSRCLLAYVTLHLVGCGGMKGVSVSEEEALGFVGVALSERGYEPTGAIGFMAADGWEVPVYAPAEGPGLMVWADGPGLSMLRTDPDAWMEENASCLEADLQRVTCGEEALFVDIEGTEVGCFGLFPTGRFSVQSDTAHQDGTAEQVYVDGVRALLGWCLEQGVL